MRRSELILSLALCGSIAVSGGLWMELRAERARAATISARRSVTLPLAPDAPTSRQSTAPATPLKPSAAAALRAESSPAPTASAVDVEDDWERERRLLQDPKYREIRRQQARLELALRRENLVRLLGFTPQQADAAIDLSIERDEADVMRGRQEFTEEQRTAEDRAYQEKLGELLGEEKRARLQNYMDSRGTRTQVDKFRSHLSGNDTLREDQIEPLIAALQPERAQMHQDIEEFRATLDPEGGPDVQRQLNEKQIEIMRDGNRRMHSAAATVLSIGQLAALDAWLKRDLEQRETQLRISRLQTDANASIPSAPDAK